MKLFPILLTLIFFAACAQQPPTVNKADEARIAKNKQVAAINEVTQLTTLAQKLEKQGRGMEIYRQANNAINDRECQIAADDAQKQLQDFEARANLVADNYKTRLQPLAADLQICVSCADKALESCVKSRAAINQAIKEIFP